MWREFRATQPKPGRWASLGLRAASWLLTFMAVVIAWVFFRAESFGAATTILARMFDFAGWAAFLQTGYPTDGVLAGVGYIQTGVPGNTAYIPAVLLIALTAVFFEPSTQAMFRDGLLQLLRSRLEIFPTPHSAVIWRPTRAWAVATGLMLAVTVLAITRGSSPFLYFNF
jgi:hypothetical protein